MLTPTPLRLREFEVLSLLPESLRQGKRSDWADQALGGGELDAFLEGPVFDRQGNLYMADIPFGRILCFSGGGSWSVVTQYDGWPNGMKLRNDKTFLVTDHKLGLVEIERDSGRLSVLCDRFEGERFHGLNDLTISRRGDVFFTDQGRSGLQDPCGRVFQLTREGSLRLLMGGIPGPNGLVLSSDERTLFLAVTRANAIWRLPLDADGSVYKAGLFIQLSGGIGPDGLARPEGEDSLIVAHPGLGVWQFNGDGTPRLFWKGEGFGYPTNLAESPLQPKCVYVTESKRAALLRIVVD